MKKYIVMRCILICMIGNWVDATESRGGGPPPFKPTKPSPSASATSTPEDCKKQCTLGCAHPSNTITQQQKCSDQCIKDQKCNAK